uniref:TF-B3 domain-containing protein n=1 Tax=Populus alba TaxID=43335 RepID=A0A4U5M9T1_POPAL|nr:hypothetical protein D5086_0000318690 [Populus alba]
MQIFSKVLKDTDVRVRFSFPTHCLEHLDFAGNNYVDLNVKDCYGELRVIRCLKRNGVYEKPVLSMGWLKFVADYGLRVGDKVVLHREDDQNLGSQFRIEAKRSIKLFGFENIALIDDIQDMRKMRFENIGFKRSCWVETWKLFDSMSVEGNVEPEEVTMIAARSACSQKGRLRLGKSFHEYVKLEMQITMNVK